MRNGFKIMLIACIFLPPLIRVINSSNLIDRVSCPNLEFAYIGKDKSVYLYLAVGAEGKICISQFQKSLMFTCPVEGLDMSWKPLLRK